MFQYFSDGERQRERRREAGGVGREERKDGRRSDTGRESRRETPRTVIQHACRRGGAVEGREWREKKE